METCSVHRTRFARLTAILLTCAFLLSLIPIFAAARYALPESDDLLYGQQARAAFASDRSIGALLVSAINQVAHHHQIAHGRFSNTFFGTLYLGAFGLSNYYSVPVLMIVSLILGTMLLSYALLVRVLSADRWTWLAVAMFVLLFCVQLLPSPAEGLFWFCGGLGYTLYYALTMTLFALLLLLWKSKRSGWRIACGTLAVLLAAVVSGLGFTVMIVTGALLVGYMVLAVYKKRRDMLVFGILTFAVFAAGCIVQLTAPATAVRAAWEQQMYGYSPSPAPVAVLLSFVYAFCTLLNRLNAGMLAYMALVVILAAPYLRRSGCRFRLPLFVVAAAFCLYATMFTASLYSTTSMGPYRQWNLFYFAMFPLWGVVSAYCAGWWIRRMEQRGSIAAAQDAADRILRRRLALIAVLAVLMLSSFVQNGVYNATSVAAIQELRSGSAAQRFEERATELACGASPAEREASRLFLY